MSVISWARVCRFNPRAPRGARLGTPAGCNGQEKFQSTRPARGATAVWPLADEAGIVSIHAPRAGRDLLVGVGEIDLRVSIHAPRAGRDGG